MIGQKVISAEQEPTQPIRASGHPYMKLTMVTLSYFSRKLVPKLSIFRTHERESAEARLKSEGAAVQRAQAEGHERAELKRLLMELARKLKQK